MMVKSFDAKGKAKRDVPYWDAAGEKLIGETQRD
jgi:hypothetical protein